MYPRATLKPAVAVALLAVAIAGCGGSANANRSRTTRSSTPARAVPVAATASQLRSLAASSGHPVFWAGPATGTYELTMIADGRTYIRYLPPGVAIGSAQMFLTVGTYLRSSPPFDMVHRAALAKHADIRAIGKAGELAVQYRSRPQSVYLIFPGARYEVEVFDPSAATALRLATTGKVVPIP